MTLFAILAIAVALQGATNARTYPLAGEWRQTDLRGIENAGGGTCVRAWFEERTFLIAPQQERYSGVYGNTIRASPVSPTSFSPACRFPAPASNPVATQARMWLIVVSPLGNGKWRVRAQPAQGSGDLQVLKTEEFETVLIPDGDTLLEETPDGQSRGLTFRRAVPSSRAARAQLEATITRLHSGGCLEVMAQILKTDAVADVCTARRQLAELQGRLVSISWESETRFDRIPAGFLSLQSRTSATSGSPLAALSGFRLQPGVLISFTAQFENNRSPGDALLVEEGNEWRVAVLWF